MSECVQRNPNLRVKDQSGEHLMRRRLARLFVAATVGLLFTGAESMVAGPEALGQRVLDDDAKRPVIADEYACEAGDGRLQNVSMTPVECGGLAATGVDEGKPVSCWNVNAYRQKSRAITNLETRVKRVRIPLSPPITSSRLLLINK